MKFTQLFKRPLNGRSRRVHGGRKRRTALAPPWNARTRKLVTTKAWPTVFRSWDRINKHLHECPSAHARKIHALRLGDFSVFTEGCWVYVLRCLHDHRVYIGQTGGRQFFRRVCDRGAEHVRLAMDYLRLSGGRKVYLPRSVYRWVARKGVENFIITPLEYCAPSAVTSRERFWMLKWGVGQLFNIDVPSVSSSRWDFLNTRKIWVREIETQGGSLLGYAKNILQSHKPLHPDTHPPPLLLAALQGSARFLPAADHKTLFDKISALFARQFKVYIPYRVPLKIPLLTGPLKKTLHTAICSAIDDDTSWPTSLKSYVKSRVHLIAQRTLSVRTVLATAQLSDLPSDILHRQSPETCPCQRWINLPGVGRLHGHAFFRNREVLANVLPPNSKCAWSVFSQNMKNATVPAYKSFKDTLLSSLKQLSGSLPDTRARVTRGIATRIADLCENNYNRFAASFPRHVYAPYLVKQARWLPPDISVGVFDKAPTLAHFACPLAWHHVFQSLFHASPRFAELITFGHPLDARCWLFWQLCDSLSIALTGNYCGFSVFRRCTPLSDGESEKAFKAYVTYPPSPTVKRAL